MTCRFLEPHTSNTLTIYAIERYAKNSKSSILECSFEICSCVYKWVCESLTYFICSKMLNHLGTKNHCVDCVECSGWWNKAKQSILTISCLKRISLVHNSSSYLLIIYHCIKYKIVTVKEGQMWVQLKLVLVFQNWTVWTKTEWTATPAASCDQQGLIVIGCSPSEGRWVDLVRC